MSSIKLNAKKLLGFRLVAGATNAKTGQKVGGKVGSKFGVKAGSKFGIKR
jgi:hypothetical protein